MKLIERYRLTWRPADQAGMILLDLAKGGVAHLHLHNTEEARFMIDVLRNESPVYFDEQHSIILTGFEHAGEDDDKPAKKTTKKAK